MVTIIIIKYAMNYFLQENGDDVSKEFIKGAQETLNIAKKLNIKKAILKEGSPSCGVNYIYDGNFNGTKIPGMGITTKILKEAFIEVISEKDLGGNKDGII